MSRGRTTAIIAFISACGLASIPGAHASGLLAPAEHTRLVLQIDNRPMVFFVAKGPADSCGPACDRWIAAEGTLTPGTAQRLEDFLAAPSRQSLPVFFHSRGGNGYEAVQIGQILRKHRMTAAIGRTFAERCRVFSTKDEACQQLISSGGDVKARLSPREGQCHSACVYAFTGASSRRVPSGAVLGVHAARIDPKILKQRMQSSPNAPAPVPADANGAFQLHLSSMGVDPRLAETASKVDTRRIYILSRDEIARFGIETGGPYESQWFQFQVGRQVGLLKSVSKQNGSDDSAAVRFGCAGPFGLRLSYVRILPNDLKYRPNVNFALTGGTELPSVASELAGFVIWSIVMPAGWVERAMESPAIAVIERYSPAADRKPERIDFSTGGLPAALTSLRKLCAERENVEPLPQRSQPPRNSRT